MEYFAKMMKPEAESRKSMPCLPTPLWTEHSTKASPCGNSPKLSDQKTIQDYSSCNQFITSKKEQARACNSGRNSSI